MIAGYHLIWTVYGYWLPNDPRGSMSREIRAASIADLGEIHYGRKRIQPVGRVMREFHEAAAARLMHPLLDFTAAEIAAVGAAIAEVVRSRNYTCYACAILPDHAHLLVRKHRDQAEEMIARFQEASRDAVLRLGRRPPDHPVWGGPGWKVYLESRDDMTRTIAYIRTNFVQFGLPEQAWPFVKPYDGWLPAQVRLVRRTSPRRA